LETFYLGDNLNDSSEKKWMSADLIDAFEKVGPLKKDRILAKIAIICKRKDGVA
jgi:hypothetical protein